MNVHTCLDLLPMALLICKFSLIFTSKFISPLFVFWGLYFQGNNCTVFSLATTESAHSALILYTDKTM